MFYVRRSTSKEIKWRWWRVNKNSITLCLPLFFCVLAALSFHKKEDSIQKHKPSCGEICLEPEHFCVTKVKFINWQISNIIFMLLQNLMKIIGWVLDFWLKLEQRNCNAGSKVWFGEMLKTRIIYFARIKPCFISGDYWIIGNTGAMLFRWINF